MRKLVFLALLFCARLGFSQGTVSHIRYGATLPATCSSTDGEVFSKTGTGAGIYSCTAPNTWTQLGAGLPPGGLPGQVVAMEGTTAGWGASSTYFAANGLTLFGDSITCAYGAQTGYDYATLLQPKYGAPFTNYCHYADYAADQVNNKIYPNLNPTRYGNISSLILIGTNDANLCGATSGCENNYYHTLLSGVAWATIPYEFKIQPQHGITAGSCTTTGTWTNTTYGNVAALSSIVPGSTLTCTSLTSGDAAVYANWFAKDGLTATATFAIDGTTVDTWDAFGFNSQTINTYNATTQTAFGTRYALSGSGSHTYKVTVGTAGSGNAFTVLWIGSPAPASGSDLGGPTQNPPRMAVGGVIRQQADAKSSTTAAYDTLALSVATQLSADGALAIPVNVRSYVDLDYATLDSDMSGATLPNNLVTPASTLAGVHPNGGISNGVLVGGHPHLADAFLAAMPTVPPPPGAGSHLFAPVITISSALSSSTNVFSIKIPSTISGMTVTIAANCSDSTFNDFATATGSTTFTIKKNGTTICTGTVAASGSTISWGSGGSATSLSSTDVLLVLYSGDSTLTGSLALAGSY